MDFAKIDQLLAAYFEGETTLEQEAQLRDYFSGDAIASEHACYTPLFKALQVSKNEQMGGALTFPKQIKSRWWIGVAAAAVIVLSVTGYVYNNANTLTQEEQEAVMAFNKSKEALFLLSKNFNKGTEELNHLNEFTKTTNKYFKQ